MKQFVNSILGLWLLLAGLVGLLMLVGGIWTTANIIAVGATSNFELIIALCGIAIAGIGLVLVNQLIAFSKLG